MRNYKPKKPGIYTLPHNVYMQCLYRVRDYERLLKERNDILNETAVKFSTYIDYENGRPIECRQYTSRGSAVSDPTMDRVLRLEHISEKCRAIELALNNIPSEYRKEVYNNVAFGARYPLYAHINTYSTWRRRFLYYVAKNSGFI